MLFSRLITLYLSLVAAGCATQQATTASSSSRYSEDLSALRPPVAVVDSSRVATTAAPKKQYVEAKYSVNKPLDDVLDSINRVHLSQRFVDGFSIQVYSGLNREEALNARKELTVSVPEVTSEVQYSQPNFRVKAGKYFNRLEAQADFVAIKRVFPSAIIVPDRISIQEE